MQEGERVMDTFQKQLHLPVTRIDDSKRMLGLLKVRGSYTLSCLPVCMSDRLSVRLSVCPSTCVG